MLRISWRVAAVWRAAWDHIGGSKVRDGLIRFAISRPHGTLIGSEAAIISTLAKARPRVRRG